jgi:hypothetical protein
MPFFYDLKFPELEAGFVLTQQLVREGTFIQANTEIALLRFTDRNVILRNAGRGVLSAWHVQEGAPVQAGQAFARMNADGEDIPYGRPYLLVEITNTNLLPK